MKSKIPFSFKFFLIGIGLLFAACDPEGKEKCDWVLEPEPSLKEKVEKGLIPVCARNRKTQKQDCRMQTTIQFAKSAMGKKFKYVDLEVKNYALPRTIKKIKYCRK